MEDGLAVRSSGLIERLERKSEVMGKDNPFYWYLHLKELGKLAQTKEMVAEAVTASASTIPHIRFSKLLRKSILRAKCVRLR